MESASDKCAEHVIGGWLPSLTFCSAFCPQCGRKMLEVEGRILCYSRGVNLAPFTRHLIDLHPSKGVREQRILSFAGSLGLLVPSRDRITIC